MSIKPEDPDQVRRYSASHKRNKKPPKERPKLRTRPQKPNTDLFLKFPPEVRHRVYELVLVDDTHPQQIRAGKIKDPALLRTSRQIRCEARATYYCLNEFSLVVSIDKLEDLKQWLQYIKLSCGKLTGTLCVRGCKWSNVGSLLPLAQIAHQSMDLRKVTTECGSLDLLGIVRSVASLGSAARAEKPSPRTLEVTFDDWLLQLLENRIFIKTSLMMGKGSRERDSASPLDFDRTLNKHEPKDTIREDRSDFSDVSREVLKDHHGLGTKYPNGWTAVN